MTVRERRGDWLVLGAFALAVFLPGLGWGLPYATDALRLRSWAIDSISPLGPLSELHNTLVAARPDRYLGYPLMHYFLLSAAYSPYLLYLVASGGLGRPTAHFPFGFSDVLTSLQHLEYIARVVSLTMAVGTVLATYETAALLWGRTAGRLAAVFVTLLYPMIYYSTTGNLDVPVLFWTSLGFLAFLRIHTEGLTTRRAVGLALSAAFAVATKEQAWGGFAAMLPFLLGARPEGGETPVRPGTLRILGWGALAFVAAYVAGTGLALNPERHLAHLAWIRAHVPFPMLPNFPATPAGYAGLVMQTLGCVVDSSCALLVALAAAGVVLTFLRRQWSAAALAAPAVGHFVLVLMPVRYAHLRYVLVMAVLCCLFAAAALAAGMASGGPRRRVAIALALITVGWLALLGADLTYQRWHDSRYDAARWLAARLRSGDAIGHSVPESSLPPLPAGIRYLHLPPDAVEERIAAARPEFVVMMPDWTSTPGLAHPAAFPVATFERLVDGSLGYRLHAQFQTPGLFMRQRLDYPTVNPPIRIFTRSDVPR